VLFFLTRQVSLRQAVELITKARVVDYLRRCSAVASWHRGYFLRGSNAAHIGRPSSPIFQSAEKLPGTTVENNRITEPHCGRSYATPPESWTHQVHQRSKNGANSAPCDGRNCVVLSCIALRLPSSAPMSARIYFELPLTPIFARCQHLTLPYAHSTPVSI